MQNYGMICGIACIFVIFHMFFREKSIQFWKDVWRVLHALIRVLLWPICTLYRATQSRWKTWKTQRKKRRLIAEFDRLHPESKDKYTDSGKLQFMSLAQDPTFQRIKVLAVERAAKDPTKSLLQHFDDIVSEEASKPITFSRPPSPQLTRQASRTP